ncbi:AAA family ATPase [Candidatus Uhrbacteria bacterium]|nr:AAA family ATPase [Candidatus Uhrbacteria bacterium]
MPTGPRVLIGITGRLASGKGRMTSEILKRYDADYVKFSDSLRHVLDAYSIPQSRDNIDSLSTFLRKTYGEDVLARAVEKKALISNREIVIIDGVRRKVDFERLGMHRHFVLVYIDVKPEIRYARSKSRNENVGDADLTYEEFLSRDSGEPQQQIESLKSVAHYVIENNSSIEEFDRQIDDVLKKALM